MNLGFVGLGSMGREMAASLMSAQRPGPLHARARSRGSRCDSFAGCAI